MKARISQLHKTESEWLKFNKWIPEPGEIIVYDPEPNGRHSYARVKIGDGKTQLQKLPFFIDSAIAAYIQNQRHSEIIEAGRVTDHI